METIPHLTTRDYTIMGLEAILFGAHAEGVRNVLAVTGDPPEVGDYPGSSGIFEIDAIGLTRLMSQLNRGEDFNGRPIDAPTSFYIGVAVNPTADDLDLELERYRQKVEAGAHYAMTQLVFDLDHLDRFFDRFGGPPPSRCSSGSARSGATASRCGSTTNCRGSSSRRSCRNGCAARGRTRPKSGWRPRRSCTRPPRSARRACT